jgi:hypothetical protein
MIKGDLFFVLPERLEFTVRGFWNGHLFCLALHVMQVEDVFPLVEMRFSAQSSAKYRTFPYRLLRCDDTHCLWKAVSESGVTVRRKGRRTRVLSGCRKLLYILHFRHIYYD